MKIAKLPKRIVYEIMQEDIKVIALIIMNHVVLILVGIVATNPIVVFMTLAVLLAIMGIFSVRILDFLFCKVKIVECERFEIRKTTNRISLTYQYSLKCWLDDEMMGPIFLRHPSNKQEWDEKKFLKSGTATLYYLQYSKVFLGYQYQQNEEISEQLIMDEKDLILKR